MKISVIIALTPLLLVLIGFFMPWVDISYGYPSGFDAVKFGLGSLLKEHQFSPFMSTLILFILIPIFELIISYYFIVRQRTRLLYLSLVSINIVFIYACYVVLKFPQIFTGFYIMSIGILLNDFNVIRYCIYDKKRLDLYHS